MKKTTSEVLKIQRQIYDYIKNKADSITSESSDLLESYKQDHLEASLRESFKSNIREFLRSLYDSEIIYLGDFHTFDQSSRNFQRLLRHLLSQKYSLTIGIEFVDAKYQERINQYLKNFITEREFLELINYHESWRFPWAHYKVIFEAAKNFDMKIIALNSEGDLEQRDRFAANVIELEFLENIQENSKLIVLFGEYHIVEDKLPFFVKQKPLCMISPNKKFSRELIVHQNMDEVYWKHFDYSNIYKNQILKFNNNEYILISSPPWVKYESMVYWFENYIDDPEFDLHEYIIESRPRSFGADVDENFFDICSQLNSTLSLNLSNEDLEDFNLCDNTNLDFVLEKLKTLPPKQTQYYEHLIKIGKLFKLPGHNLYYCSQYSVNRLSFLCGLHLHHLLLKKSHSNYEKSLTSATDSDYFVFHIFQYALSYICSKFVNPYRKCNLYLDFKENLTQAIEQKIESSIFIYEMIISLIDSTSNIKYQKYFEHPMFAKHRFQVQKSIAYFIGEMIHSKILEGDDSSLNDLITYIQSFDTGVEKLIKFLDTNLEKKQYTTSRKRTF